MKKNIERREKREQTNKQSTSRENCLLRQLAEIDQNIIRQKYLKKKNNPNDSKQGDWGDNHHDIKTEKNRFTLVFAFASNG